MDKFKIELPELCLVAMVGASSSGKSTFAKKYFLPTEILSSDFFRGMICDNENNQHISGEAFDLLYYAARKRLSLGKLTVIDATNIQPNARKPILELAKEQNVHAAAIVLNPPVEVLLQRNAERTDRTLSEKIIYDHYHNVARTIKNLKRDGFRYVYVLDSAEQAENAEIIRTRLKNNRKDDYGPFDIIGDIHGCCDELELLLSQLGYVKTETGYAHPDGRKAAFLGDFCDRGNRNADTLRLVMDMVNSGNALAVLGNHDIKLLKYLRGKNISMSHGIEKTIAELETRGEEFKTETAAFLTNLTSHYVLDGGRLVIAHAGLKQEYIGRSTGRVQEFCLYGDTTGERDEYGLPIRLDWASEYRGRAAIVYGHIAGRSVRAANGTFCIDTGCVFGGKLTAYRYPEKETVSVDALQQYYEPVKPLDGSLAESDDMLSGIDCSQKLYITTELMPDIDIHENNCAAALESMSRFGADPHWLIYLPPTMSPCETSDLDGFLEHPLQAFEYYKSKGIRHVICEKKHMGSRAVIVLCKTAEAAQKRFRITDGTNGIIYTRTGRRFFDDLSTEKALLERLNTVLTKTGFWADFKTDWVCLDTELMPWSEKAQGLLRTQYAPAGRAGIDSLSAAINVLEQAVKRTNLTPELSQTTSGQNVLPSDLLEKYKAKLTDIEKYAAAYREYCWTVNSIDDFRIAPFHLLACEGRVFHDQTHLWHMETIKKYMTGIDPVFMETPYLCVDTEEEASIQSGVQWWLSLTASGGEGMVVKPESYIARQADKLLQPAVKCRGSEYLRIIYGAEYLEPEHLSRLKKRSLGRKRMLALKEFSLGMEALTRFVNNEPLSRVHECAFGVLALESEPVDPRL